MSEISNSYHYFKKKGGEGWLGFLDLWSGQKPWWNRYLTPVVNFGEVQRITRVLNNSLNIKIRNIYIYIYIYIHTYIYIYCRKKLVIPGKTAALFPEFTVELQPRFLYSLWRTCPWAENFDDGYSEKSVCALRLHGWSVNFYGDCNQYEIQFFLFTHIYYINTLWLAFKML